MSSSPVYLSHPPMRPLATPSSRPMNGSSAAARFVDATRGSDTNTGSEESPWKTIGHALRTVEPGQTIYLREGNFFERVRISRCGLENAPITLRSYPGELAIIDGGFPEFSQQPTTAWERVDAAMLGRAEVPGDYFRSKHTYPNERAVLAYFADSMVPLVTYQHRIDIEETSRIYLEQQPGQCFPLPVYFGPGVWYDAQSGHVYIRLTHTNYNFDVPMFANYQGERDPSKLGLVVAPLSSLPLLLEGAEHVTIQDVVIRGGGENTVLLRDAQFITLDNVVVYSGTYGLRSESSGPVRVLHSAIYGAIPPWYVSGPGSLRNIPGPRQIDKPEAGRSLTGRDVARLNTHNLVVIEGRTEDMFNHAFPGNHHWEFAYCDLTDAHDGIHLGGECTLFHHNRVDRMLDDGLYLSPLTPQYLDQTYVFQNLFVRCALPLGFGGLTESGGPIYVFRNVFDQRTTTQQSHDKPQFGGGFITGHFRGRARFDVGNLFIYQNTIVSKISPKLIQSSVQDIERTYAMSTLVFPRPGQKRRVFNNLFVYLQGMIPPRPSTLPAVTDDVEIDGNLHWDVINPHASAAKLQEFQRSEFFELSKTRYAPGWEAHSRASDPCFVSFAARGGVSNDYRLNENSAAIGCGIELPQELRDPLRPPAGVRPDAGALPRGSEPMRVGRVDPKDAPEVYAWLERTP